MFSQSIRKSNGGGQRAGAHAWVVTLGNLPQTMMFVSFMPTWDTAPSSGEFHSMLFDQRALGWERALQDNTITDYMSIWESLSLEDDGCEVIPLLGCRATNFLAGFDLWYCNDWLSDWCYVLKPWRNHDDVWVVGWGSK